MVLGLPQFMNPGRLWLLALVPVLVIAYVIVLRLRKRTGMRFTNTALLSKILPRQSSWRRHVAVAMMLLSLIALSFAWARPMGITKVPRETATIVLVIDVSQSMASKDVAPNRLDAAKKAAIEFINQLPSQYNVSIVALSGSPQTRLPPNVDRGTAQQAINSLELEDGTAIGESLQQGLNALKARGKDGKTVPGSIVLLSDGTNTVGQSPMQVAAKATKEGVKIYTIAFGTETGYVDLDGKRERVAPDKATLQSIANQTGGKFFAAASSAQLSEVYKNLRGEVGYVEVPSEVTAQWAFYALAFALLAGLGAVSMAARWPS